MQKITALLLLFTLPCLLFAQPGDEGASPERKAYENVQALKKGVLVVRLASNQNKINAMKKVIESPTASEKDKTYMRRQLETTIAEGHQSNLVTASVFRSTYHFSEVYFMYDTAVALLRKGVTKGYFLNEDLSVNPEIDLAGKNWFTLRIGYTDSSQGSGAEALIISDAELKDLLPPFPGQVRLDNIGLLLNQTLAPDIALRKRMVKAVKRLEKRLVDFYERN